MKVFQIVAALSVCVPMALATPTPTTEEKAARAADPPLGTFTPVERTYDLTLYEHAYYQGRSNIFQHYEAGRCYSLNNNWNDRASSLKLDVPRFCSYYEHWDCTGREVKLRGDIDWLGNFDFNDKLSSWKCWNYT